MQLIWARIILIFCLIIGGCCYKALAQTPPTLPSQKTNEEEQRLRIVTNEVRLPLRVFDSVGRRVIDLAAKEVIVLDAGNLPFMEGQQVRLIVEFPSETPEDVLHAAAEVYEGLSDEEIDEIEDIALNRRDSGVS